MSGQWVKVTCAFCRGSGCEPFDGLSPSAACQVCGGSGMLKLRSPLAKCAFCKGTGVHPGSRLTCTSCRGVGFVEIPEVAVECVACGGSGRAADDLWPDSLLPCGYCRGKGVVARPGHGQA